MLAQLMNARRSRVTRRARALHWQLLALGCGCAWSCGGDTHTATQDPPFFPGGGGASTDSPSGSAGDTCAANQRCSSGSAGESSPLPNGISSSGSGTATDAGSDARDAGDGGGVAPSEPEICDVIPNTGSLSDGDANIDLAAPLQRIAGFGGMDGGFYAELTAAQVDAAFGDGPGQIGLSILRIRIPEAEANFGRSLAAATRAVGWGATVMATPWTPPANMKSNASLVSGSLNVDSYGAYADHLLGFRDFMQANGVPLYAISVQNEPDIRVTYESCDWTANQLVDWIKAHGAKFGDTKLIAAEAFQFSRAMTDPILNDAAAAANVDIVAGHVYGAGLADYPLARQKGKEVWMTEHYTDSASPANDWPLALDVGTDIQRSMTANFSAYVWWAIRRAYGLLTEDGLVSKRGYVMAQYAKFIHPGYTRISATQPSTANVAVTAYKGGNQVVVVAVNRNAQPQSINLDVFNSCATGFTRFTTSATKNLADDGPVTLADRRATVSLDGQSITTFVSQ
jgi:O-glycosyl hydrolase